MSDIAPNTISPQQGGLAGTTVGNVPGAAKTGLGVEDPSLPEPKQDVIGNPEIAAGTKLEPLEKDQLGSASSSTGSTKNAQAILDDLSNSATGQSATEALSNAQATVTSALGSAATAAQGLVNQAYDAVLNATGTADGSKK
ncbi:hypothetical protein NCC49_001011 [Naganishia albida]|nr:hypothetical protein NCC49_001011 [Naganishia albida]